MVMFRTYLSRWRSLRRRHVLQPLVEAVAEGDAYANVDVRASLGRGLADLPRLHRAVLVFTYLDDKAGEGIAELLNRRPATIRSLRFRGLKALRDRFSADDAAVVEAYRGTN
jgi:DNA-directed RNA polymerase specialized sigma24 family protein